jgi:hypothetical protein
MGVIRPSPTSLPGSPGSGSISRDEITLAAHRGATVALEATHLYQPDDHLVPTGAGLVHQSSLACSRKEQRRRTGCSAGRM